MSVDSTKLSAQLIDDIGQALIEERLDIVNEKVTPVIVKDTIYTRYIKRILDIVLSFILIIVTLPINIVIGTVTLFDVGSPIFFVQKRIGKNGKPFNIVKFRNIKEKPTDFSLDDAVVTPFGKFVRKTSLDELLNFYSVFVGDMSLIGPRPLFEHHYKQFNRRHICRMAVRPGIECPPRDLSLNMRTWQSQFENDVWYVENVSFATDFKLFINLIRFTFKRLLKYDSTTSAKGVFIGYDFDGNAISLSDLPDDYVNSFIENEEKTTLSA